MTRPMVRIVDCANGDAVTDREMTDAEFAQYTKDQTDAKAKAKQEADNKATLEATKQSVLTKLGITAAELKALLG